MWKISQPAKCGPLTSHFSRLPSDVRTNAPLRVPARTRTLLIYFSLLMVNRTKDRRIDRFIIFFGGRVPHPSFLKGRMPVLSQLAFFIGTLAPFLRASERPMAIACLRLVTLPPLPPWPERSVPRFSRCRALLTLLPAALPYLVRPDFLRDLEPFLAAMRILLPLRG